MSPARHEGIILSKTDLLSFLVVNMNIVKKDNKNTYKKSERGSEHCELIKKVCSFISSICNTTGPQM